MISVCVMYIQTLNTGSVLTVMVSLLFDSVWFGARNSILIAVIATFLNVIIGLLCRCCLGISKTFDMIMMEIYNIISNIPSLLVVYRLDLLIRCWFLEYDFCHDRNRLDRYCLYNPYSNHALSWIWSITWLLAIWEHQRLRL